MASVTLENVSRMYGAISAVDHVNLTIKSGEFAREGAIKVVPAMMRPVIKSFYKGPVLAAAKGLPFVGKFLLQRNVIKIGIPAVGIPLAVGLNQW